MPTVPFSEHELITIERRTEWVGSTLLALMHSSAWSDDARIQVKLWLEEQRTLIEEVRKLLR